MDFEGSVSQKRFEGPEGTQGADSAPIYGDGSATQSHATELPEVALEAVRYDTLTGLVPVIVQDSSSSQVLMQAYANREALKRTLATGEAWFFSRSRQDYWLKGETSGNRQHVRDVLLDCDGDSVLYLVDADGPACHTGEVSCFYRRIVREVSDSTVAVEARVEDSRVQSVFDTLDAQTAAENADIQPAHIGDMTILSELWDVLNQRFRERPQGSYTSYLFEQGIDKAAKKLGEEGVEVVIASKNAVEGQSGHRELATESADLLFHLLVVWKMAGLAPEDVWNVLRERHAQPR